MKQPVIRVGAILATTVLFVFASHAADAPARPDVAYDQKTDRLSVTAKEMSYKDTMARIATLSGIEILMDPAAEHTLTATLRDVPLERGLKELSRQTSFILVYADPRPGQKEPLLISMRVLPKGESRDDGLRPLLAPGGEAFIREKNRGITPEKEPEIFSHAKKRWEARLEKMPPAQRQQLLKEAREKLATVEQRRAERDQRREARAKKRAEHEQRRQTRLEELKTSNPELYELRVRQHEERSVPKSAPPQ